MEKADSGGPEQPVEINKLVKPGPDDAQRSLAQVAEGAVIGSTVGPIVQPIAAAARDRVVNAAQAGWARLHPQQQDSAPAPQPDDGGFLPQDSE